MTDHNPTEHAVIFTSDGLALAGTLTSPATETPSPAVLMLPGSGQVDRNENAKRLAINQFPYVRPLFFRQVSRGPPWAIVLSYAYDLDEQISRWRPLICRL